MFLDYGSALSKHGENSFTARAARTPYARRLKGMMIEYLVVKLLILS